MRNIIATFCTEEKIAENTYRNSGTVVFRFEAKELPVKYSELKSAVKKTLPNYLRIKCLESICDVTDLVEFDE